ncbi:MAG: hypothetical protein AB8G05_06210 [Oligoflexales bacterium]
MDLSDEVNVEGLKDGESFIIREKKTQKVRRVVLNEASHAAIQNYLKVDANQVQKPLFSYQGLVGIERSLLLTSTIL